jgi:hypothetical protein
MAGREGRGRTGKELLGEREGTSTIDLQNKPVEDLRSDILRREGSCEGPRMNVGRIVVSVKGGLWVFMKSHAALSASAFDPLSIIIVSEC